MHLRRTGTVAPQRSSDHPRDVQRSVTEGLIGVPTVVVTMTRIDGEREVAQMRLRKDSTVKQIKSRVEMEMGIPPHEQLLIFRGVYISQPGGPAKDEGKEPLNRPDLEEIIEAAGEAGLHMAVCHKPFRLAAFLRGEGFEDVNQRAKTGATAMHRAVRKCQLNVMEELIENQNFTVIEEQDRAGQTALHTAVACRNREACEILLGTVRFQAVGVQDAAGRTALHLAALWGDLPVVKRILERSSFRKPRDVLLEDQDGYTAYAYAVDCGNMAVAAEIAALCPGAPAVAAQAQAARESVWKAAQGMMSTDAVFGAAMGGEQTQEPSLLGSVEVSSPLVAAAPDGALPEEGPARPPGLEDASPAEFLREAEDGALERVAEDAAHETDTGGSGGPLTTVVREAYSKHRDA